MSTTLTSKQNDARKRHLKGVWGSVSDVKRLTIWKTKNDLRRARRNGHLEMDKCEGKIVYRLDSIHDLFKQQSA